MRKQEVDAVAERYARRDVGDRYSMLRPEVWLSVQERQRTILRLFREDLGWEELSRLKLTEVGCGNGDNLLDFLRFGFIPANLSGIELLPDRAAHARNVLSADVEILEGDATAAKIEMHSQDIVLQSTVFSSLLDDKFQQDLASKMWDWVKPGGGVLWYDFVYDNPSNPDVRRVSLKRIKDLFPAGKMIVKKITLAPPISRRVCGIHPKLYHLLNALPVLRTHVLCWIQKSK